MNDTEIIKALECHQNTRPTCAECPFHTRPEDCIEQLQRSTLVLIYRQQTEIENLKEVKHGHWVKCGYKWQCTHCQSLINIDGTPEENLLNYCPNCGAKMEMFGNPE